MNPNVSMWFNIAVSVTSGLAGAATLFTDLFGQGTAQKIVAGLSLAGIVVGAVNAGLHATSTAQPGPLAPKA